MTVKPPKSLILAIDQGTTSTRAILFDHAGAIQAIGQQPFTQHYPQPGWVEHDAEEIWATTVAVIRDALARAGVDGNAIAAIGITNQRETAVVWHRHTGQPIHHAIVWQSRQTADICSRLRAAGHEPMVQRKTGLVLDPYFSASKVQWLLDHVDGARAAATQGDLLFGTIDAWLIWKLTGGRVHATDVSNAARTSLYNIHDMAWDDDLLDLFDIPPAMLPEVRDSSGIFGYTAGEGADVFGGLTIPVAGAAGDQQAALFGQACFTPGMVKNTYGTGCFLLMQTGEQAHTSQHGLLTTVAWRIGGRVQYALEGSVFVAGAAMQWLRDELGVLDSTEVSASLAARLRSNDGVYLVPAFVGLGAPYWDAEARGAIYGLTRGTTRAHLVRAALESMAYQTADVLQAMVDDTGLAVSTLRVDGGASSNGWLMQFQADLLAVTVERPRVTESTALGAAYLAGLAVGFWASMTDIATQWTRDGIYEPVMGDVDRHRLYAGWQDAVRRTRS